MSFLQSKESVSRKESESDGSRTKKKKSKSKKRKIHTPEHSSIGKLSSPPGNTSQNNKLPKVTAAVQQHLCSNSKAHRINAWVNSVDTSYPPSEQGSCISVPCAPSNYAESDDFNQSGGDFSTRKLYNRHIYEQNTMGNTSTKLLKKENVNTDKHNNNVRPNPRHASHPYKKEQFSTGVNIPVAHNGVSKSSKQGIRTPASTSTVHTPFSPLSHHPTVLGMNSDKADTGQKFPSSTVAYQTQAEEDMQLDSQMSFHSYGNGGYEVELGKTQQFDSNDIAMEIDNYEELEDQIRAEVSMCNINCAELSDNIYFPPKGELLEFPTGGWFQKPNILMECMDQN